MKKLNIYFDNAATTPPLPWPEVDAQHKRADSMGGFFGNPSSPHGMGIRAERALIAARAETAGFLGCRESEIIYTSGGTEANNLAILGFALANKRQGLSVHAEPWEHPSVIEPIRFAGELGLGDAGIRLVCLSQVNPETGDIADINEIAAVLKKENPETVVHVDGVQGFCKENTDLTNIDMYSFSGHKIHGAGGVGGLFVRDGIRLVPLMRGGGQENGIRAGTENIPGILRMNAAARALLASREENHALVSAVKNELLKLTAALPDVVINTLGGDVSPYILNLSFLGIKGETLVHILSEKGIFASMGAACRSRKKQKSALELMGFSQERAQAAVRFSFSHLNTAKEAAITAEIIIGQVSLMRRVLGRHSN